MHSLASFLKSPAQFSVQKVTPQSDGSSSKVKVKVRVNVHGIFSVSSASLVEVHKSEENEEPMETDQNAKEEEVTLMFRSTYAGILYTTFNTVLYFTEMEKNSNWLFPSDHFSV